MPYREELDRKRSEKADRDLDKAIADFANERGIPVPEPHTYRGRSSEDAA